MSLTKLIPSLVVAALAVGMTTAPAKAQVNPGSGIIINDINLTDIDIEDGVLTAAGTVSGTIAGLPFTTDIENFVIDLLPNDPETPAEECSVLHLELAPIDLDLLGLNVNTSAICLNVTAIEGGGLLGDLLCSLAGGGALGGPLGDVLNLRADTVLSPLDRIALLDQVAAGNIEELDLTGALVQALNATLAGNGTPTPVTAQQAPEEICDGPVHILNLAVGPLNLNLLGLVVNLDDCEGGPVRVCVSATPGAGLLGDLLGGLLGGGLNLDLLEDLIGAILDGLPATGVNASAKQVDQLVKEANRILRDGNLSDQELRNLTKSVQKTVRKS